MRVVGVERGISRDRAQAKLLGAFFGVPTVRPNKALVQTHGSEGLSRITCQSALD